MTDTTAPTTPGPTPAQVLASVDAAAPRLRELAPTTRAAGKLPDEVMTLLRGAGVFGINFPATQGGTEMRYEDQLRLIETLGRADGSVGWACMVLADSGVHAGRFGAQIAAELWPERTLGTATSLVKPGTAVKAEGGYRLSGRYRFGTGTYNASVFACLGLVDGESGPQRALFFVPADQVTIYDTWDTIGLQGTGSTDYELTDVFVAERHMYLFNPGVDESLPPLSRYYDFTTINQMGVPLGMAAHLLDEVHVGALARFERAGERGNYQIETGLPEAEAMLGAARAYAFEFARAADEAVFGDGEFTPELLGRLPQTTTAVAQLTRRAVELGLELVGTDAGFASRPYEQLYEDFRVAMGHVIFRRPFYAESLRRRQES